MPRRAERSRDGAAGVHRCRGIAPFEVVWLERQPGQRPGWCWWPLDDAGLPTAAPDGPYVSSQTAYRHARRALKGS